MGFRFWVLGWVGCCYVRCFDRLELDVQSSRAVIRFGFGAFASGLIDDWGGFSKLGVSYLRLQTKNSKLLSIPW